VRFFGAGDFKKDQKISQPIFWWPLDDVQIDGDFGEIARRYECRFLYPDLKRWIPDMEF